MTGEDDALQSAGDRGMRPNYERVEFRARDGEPLVGRFFAAPAPRLGVLVAPATGVPARFYAAFARDLAAHSISTFVFDYRGIGRSLRGHVRDSLARKQDWGQLDLSAAFDQLGLLAPGLPRSYVGHSAGAQLVGLMDNAARIERIVQYAGSSGYIGGMGWRYRLLGRLLLQVYGPLSIRFLGYGATRKIGWGENLPKGVMRQWAEWCSSPGYLDSSLGVSIAEHWYGDIRCPLLSLRATDDPIATEANVDDILRLFQGADVVREVLDPDDFQLKSLGHIDFFRSRCASLWPRVQRFLLAE